MSEAIAPGATGAAGEQKQRITRSSMEGSTSPASNKTSLTPTPTPESNNTSSSSVPDEAAADNPVPSSLNPSTSVKRSKMGMVAAPAASSQVTRRSLRSSNKLNTDEESDKYCWICRKDGIVIPCQLCPRVYHLKCLGLQAAPKEDWICMECEKVMRSECEDTRPQAMSSLSIDQLITCLHYTLERMKVPNSEVFQVPVDPAMEPEYHNIVAHPMDMSTLDKNVSKKVYGSTEAFHADAKWILHNSIVYNGMHNKYTVIAKAVLKACRHQISEIETCPDCFLASCTQENNWFCTPCRFSHPLVWAKLKGYPYWPAKALREADGQVDCRFFGAHDKAWVPSHQVFMLSSEPPAPVKNKKGSGFEDAMSELDKYITKFKARYGTFTYYPPKEPYRSNNGQLSSISEIKKRPLPVDSEEEIPAAKKFAEENSVKQETPEVKREPNRPGVFTVSDEVLSAATSVDLSALRDDGASPERTETVMNKIEAKLKLAMEAEQHSQTLVNDTPEVAAIGNGHLVEENNEKTETSQDTVSNRSSQPLLPVTQPPESSLKPPVPSTPQPSVESTSQSAPSEHLSSSHQPHTSSVSDTDKSSQLSVEPMDTTTSSAKQSTLPTDKQYTDKLSGTIDSCRNQLGVEESQEAKDESSEGESSSESESEEEVHYHGRRKRRYYVSRSRHRVDVRDILSEKENAVTDQLLDLMKDGLESTIKDIVRQSFRHGKPTVPAEDKIESTNTPSTSTDAADSSADNKPNKDDSAPAASSAGEETSSKPNHKSPVKEAAVKGEASAENSVETPADSVAVSSELVEKLTWKHKCEIEAVKHSAELTAMEMRKSVELEKDRALWRLRKQLEHKYKKIIEETKKKQWCAMCGKEAIFYCCWNTSYCDYPCQQKHWPNHLKTCAQIAKDPESTEKKQTQQRQSPAPSNSERGHANPPPPPYMPTPSSSGSELPAAPQYQLMQGQVQYMPAAVSANASHVYQAQLPVQPMHMQSGSRSQVSPAGAPMLYPVMTPPSTIGPPQPQSYMLSQRQPYRLAPKYS